MAATLGSFSTEAEARRPAKTVKAKAVKAKTVKRKVVKASTVKARVSKAKTRKGKRFIARRAPAPAPFRLVDGKPVLKASVAYVIDQDSGQVLLGKNDDDIRPIASLTKLMTAVIIADAKLPLDERITITAADVDRLKGSSSRLRVGTELTRGQALHLSLMSSENRAAHALARTYPGGETAFVAAMNNKARQLGMDQTHYVEPTGLSSENRSSARDLATLADAAYERPLLRKYSTSPGYLLDLGKRELQYVNTNRLVREGDWPIGLQKTGYISEAGQCLVVQTKVKDRNLIMVFLDSASKVTRIRDAEIVRRWLRMRPAAAEGTASKGDGGEV
ncbi:MAG: murein-DD-endopeptidase Serine peptidase family [Ramlibacter sp.]|jgi:D-alanyl-D-alanine endopeptidase (penicillin-binding protein 7)|nr:murein-DD-endopeptidase Serine peptidase family [Ramlibacter sp.]